MKLKYIYIILMLLLILTSCSDDDNSISPESENQSAKQLSMKEIDLPSAMKQSNNPHVFSAQLYITTINAFSNFSLYFTPPSNVSAINKSASINEDWSKSWNLQNGLTINFNYFENTTNFGWTVNLDGSDGVSTYNNWKFLEAEETIGSNSGFFRTFIPGASDIGSEWTYSNTASGMYQVNLKTFSNGINDERLEVISNTNFSGTLNRYSIDNNVESLRKTITWTSAGTGEWWEYDLDGNVKETGTF